MDVFHTISQVQLLTPTHTTRSLFPVYGESHVSPAITNTPVVSDPLLPTKILGILSLKMTLF